MKIMTSYFIPETQNMNIHFKRLTVQLHTIGRLLKAQIDTHTHTLM